MRQNWQHLAGSMFSLKYMYKEIHIYNRPLNNMGFNCQVHLYVFLFVFFSINSATVLQNLLLVESSDLEPPIQRANYKVVFRFLTERRVAAPTACCSRVSCVYQHTHTHTNILQTCLPSTTLPPYCEEDHATRRGPV